jgi:hypothetical protein
MQRLAIKKILKLFLSAWIAEKAVPLNFVRYKSNIHTAAYFKCIKQWNVLCTSSCLTKTTHHSSWQQLSIYKLHVFYGTRRRNRVCNKSLGFIHFFRQCSVCLCHIKDVSCTSRCLTGGEGRECKARNPEYVIFKILLLLPLS